METPPTPRLNCTLSALLGHPQGALWGSYNLQHLWVHLQGVAVGTSSHLNPPTPPTPLGLAGWLDLNLPGHAGAWRGWCGAGGAPSTHSAVPWLENPNG